jgi:hypothetical protein
MKSGLRFNICELESSHLANDRVPAIAKKIAENIPESLAYSCRFWAIHLQANAPVEKTILEVKNFLFTSFLFWLEVLSLQKEVEIASPNLVSLKNWINVCVHFVQFGITMTNTASHRKMK